MVVDFIKGAILRQQTDINDLAQDVAEYYFDIINEHSITLSSQITDNWLENNTVVNDHIANNPVVINLRGISGELVYVPSDSAKNGAINYINKFINDKGTASTINKLSVIPSLLPPIDNVTQLAKNIVTYIDASYNRYTKILNRLIDNPDNETKLQKIYNRFETMRLQKLPFEVETPYKKFKNMYIQSLTFRQGNALYVTDIELSLKQLNFTDTLTTKADEKVLAKYNQFQRAQIENHGKVQGPRKSLAAQLYDGDKLTLTGD